MRLRHSLPGYRFAVIGSGAVGGFYGAKLASYGRDVHFLVRAPGERAVLRKHGWRVRSRTGDLRVARTGFHESAAAIGPCDIVLVAIKSTGNDRLAEILPPLLHGRTLLVSLQGGLGNEETLAEILGDAGRVLGGCPSVGLTKSAPGLIEHFGGGSIAVGEQCGYPLPRTHDLVWELKRCGVAARVVGDLAQERWRQVVSTLPFQALTVLATAGARGRGSSRIFSFADVLADDSLRYLALRLLEELIVAGRQLGYQMPGDFAALILRRVRELGAYQPGLLLDFLAGRPTELASLCGEPYRRAFNAGAEVGRLEAVYHLLRAAVTLPKSEPSSAP